MPTPVPTPTAHPEETLGQYLARHLELLKHREFDLESYAGDGPTAVQANDLIEKLRLFTGGLGEGVTVTVGWDIFRSAVDMETSWLFPEKDPLAGPITWALEQLQTSTGKLLEEAGPVKHEDLEEYVNLSLVSQAAKRQVKLNGNGINWRLVLARFLYWVGGGKAKS